MLRSFDKVCSLVGCDCGGVDGDRQWQINQEGDVLLLPRDTGGRYIQDEVYQIV